MAKGRVALAMLEREHPKLYEGLFLQNRSIKYDGDLLRLLCDLGLVRQEGKRFRSSYHVRLFLGLFLVTDPFTLPEQDRVFPLSEDESLFLAAHLHVKRGDVVLYDFRLLKRSGSLFEVFGGACGGGFGFESGARQL